MKVNLKGLKKGNYEDIKNLKRFLYQSKKSGILFFEPSVFEINNQIEFDLYFVDQASSKSTINAFPIPVQEYRMIDNHMERYYYLKSYFDKYYNDVADFSYGQFKLYSVYWGTSYIWCYKKEQHQKYWDNLRNYDSFSS
ncbi:hypothetical protein BAQ47_03240 [Bacillus tropicus]|uniref:hypothetical protein n=1 Tax=Bacillus tropicus TaxID=2026188 RepID=UPI0008FDB19B|nr:hypothetical protein [Bacillus tropicus]OJE31676.1 hypothetical protein BAQ47_03240 [Bacillus tropicus]